MLFVAGLSQKTPLKIKNVWEEKRMCVYNAFRSSFLNDVRTAFMNFRGRPKARNECSLHPAVII